ncbi:MAG TPA: transglycosylase SLT domain-containing protein [Candidatus Binatia bacterium]|nr:transglycosylase SLT domain-containing protein [Candidatus Binatia bacterium]
MNPLHTSATLLLAMRSLPSVLLFIFAAFPLRLFGQELDPATAFAKAYGYYSGANMTQAKELLEKVADAKHPLADYSLYYLAVIAFNETNWELSRRLLLRLREHYPQSLWFQPAQLQRAKIDLAEKKYPQAIEKLRSLRAVKSGSQAIVEESFYLEAKAQEAEGHAGQAYSLHQELRALYPNSRWTPLARIEIARLRAEYPDQFGLNTDQAMVEEAGRLVREKEFGEAGELYKKLLDNNFDPAGRLGLLASLADLHMAVRKRNEAIPFLKAIVGASPASPEAAKALYQLGQILWNRHENVPALSYFKQVMDRHPTSAYAARSQFAAADIHEALGKKDQAIALYSAIPIRFPGTQPADDALWRLGWLHYRAGDLSRACATFRTLAGQATQSAVRTAGLYWQGRCAEKAGDTELAKELYREVHTSGGESYYQPLAARALARLGLVVNESPVSSGESVHDGDPPVSAAAAFHLSRARALTEISLHQLAVTELDEINRIAGSQARVRALLMREYFRNRAYNRSLALANQLSDDSGEKNKYRFPLAYWETIQRKAQERNLDPYLVVALIRQESLFDAGARSPAFALGLMQLLPSTATNVAKQLGLPPPSNEDLFEPELNLTLGTQYLKDLLKRYSNNWFKAIAAYNAGERAVDRWEKEIATDDMEEFVERIPYLETRSYVKLVMRNHRVYQRLYNQG